MHSSGLSLLQWKPLPKGARGSGARAEGACSPPIPMRVGSQERQERVVQIAQMRMPATEHGSATRKPIPVSRAPRRALTTTIIGRAPFDKLRVTPPYPYDSVRLASGQGAAEERVASLP